MLAFESPSGLAVIEPVSGSPPTHELMLPTIVFRVAAGAVRRRLHSSALNDPRMVAALFGEATPDFLMTIEALELGRARAHDVTGSTLEWRVQAPMRLRQRAGRHLGV